MVTSRGQQQWQGEQKKFHAQSKLYFGAKYTNQYISLYFFSWTEKTTTFFTHAPVNSSADFPMKWPNCLFFRRRRTESFIFILPFSIPTPTQPTGAVVTQQYLPSGRWTFGKNITTTHNITTIGGAYDKCAQSGCDASEKINNEVFVWLERNSFSSSCSKCFFFFFFTQCMKLNSLCPYLMFADFMMKDKFRFDRMVSTWCSMMQDLGVYVWAVTLLSHFNNSFDIIVA